MRFENPDILWALFLVAIPLIIHLFNFKRFKKVYFSNLAFLKTVEQQTKKHSRLRHLLVLISRMLFVAALVTAFAKPYFPSSTADNGGDAEKRILIYLDNSFSMQQKGHRGVLLEEGRNTAREISRSYRPVDRFKFVSNDIYSFDGGFLSRDDFMSDLRDCDYEPYSVSMSEIIASSKTGASKKDLPTDVFLISDFQKSVSDINKWQLDTNVNYWLVPLASASAENIFIDSCYLDAPVALSGKAVKLNFILRKNYEHPSGDLEVKLTVNGRQKAVTTVNMSALSKKITFSFMPDSSELQAGKIQIGDFPVTFDDEFYFSFRIRRHFKVVGINENGKDDFIFRFYRKDSSVNFIGFRRDMIDYSAFKGADLVLLDGLTDFDSGLLDELKRYVDNYGKLLFIPSSKCPAENIVKFNKFFGTGTLLSLDTTRIKISELDLQSPLFKDVFDLKNGKLPENTDFPFFKYRYILQRQSDAVYNTEINFADGSPLLFSQSEGRGKLYYFTAALDEHSSNLAHHAFFVPLFYNLAIVDEQNMPLFFRVGDDVIKLGNVVETGDLGFHITDMQNGNDFIPGVKERGGEVTLFLEGRIRKSGNYVVSYPPALKIPLSFNYAPEESMLNSYSLSDIRIMLRKRAFTNVKIIENQGKNIGVELNVIKQTGRLWKIFILLALMFLVIEVFLLRFLK